MKRILPALLLLASTAWGEPGHSGSVSISTTRIGPSGSLLIHAEGTNDKISITTGNFRRVSSTQFFGDGSGLTGISASVPANISVTNAYVGGTVSGSSLISTTFGGVVSSTYGYSRYVSTTALSNSGLSNLVGVSATGSVSANKFIGDGSLLSNLPTQANDWSTFAGVPLQVQAVSNSGSISLTNLTMSGVVSGASLISTSAGGLISSTFLNVRQVSGTNISASMVSIVSAATIGSSTLPQTKLDVYGSMFLTNGANDTIMNFGSNLFNSFGMFKWDNNNQTASFGISGTSTLATLNGRIVVGPVPFNYYVPYASSTLNVFGDATISSGASINTGRVASTALEVSGTVSSTYGHLKPGVGTAAPYTCNAAKKGDIAMASNTLINTCNGSAWQNPVGAAAVW